MLDNLPDTAGDFFALPDHRVLALEGPDATRFAHAQFMNDVTGLADGHWQWNGWLTPKGRVMALFALLRFDAQSLWLLLPDADPEELREALQRFVFRSKVKLTARGDLRVAGRFGASSHASGAQLSAGEKVELDAGSPTAPRALSISAAAAASDDAGLARWKQYDLRHGLPRLEQSQVEAWTPQQLSLDRLQAYSVKKGCYPGQEIVARTHFLGQAKRGLMLFEADAGVPVGADVTDGERVLGTIVSSAPGYVVLAVLPLGVERAGLRANEIALASIPLIDGLAR